MKCKNIYLTRHGVRQTQLPNWAEPYAEEPFEGPEYDFPLAHMGQLQAEALAKRMKDIRIDYIFSSPFSRAIETSIPLARQKGIPIKIEYGMTEGMMSAWFGKSFPELPSTKVRHEKYPEIDPDYETKVFPRFPEERADILARLAKTISILTEDYGPNIMLVGHGASCLGATFALLGQERRVNLSFCSFHHFVREENGWALVDVDAFKHLQDKNLYVPLLNSVSAQK